MPLYGQHRDSLLHLRAGLRRDEGKEGKWPLTARSAGASAVTHILGILHSCIKQRGSKSRSVSRVRSIRRCLLTVQEEFSSVRGRGDKRVLYRQATRANRPGCARFWHRNPTHMSCEGSDKRVYLPRVGTVEGTSQGTTHARVCAHCAEGFAHDMLRTTPAGSCQWMLSEDRVAAWVCRAGGRVSYPVGWDRLSRSPTLAVITKQWAGLWTFPGSCEE